MTITNKDRRHPLVPDRITWQRGKIDEIVIGDWLHVEVMDHRDIWVRLGERTFMVHVPPDPDSPVVVRDQED